MEAVVFRDVILCIVAGRIAAEFIIVVHIETSFKVLLFFSLSVVLPPGYFSGFNGFGRFFEVRLKHF